VTATTTDDNITALKSTPRRVSQFGIVDKGTLATIIILDHYLRNDSKVQIVDMQLDRIGNYLAMPEPNLRMITVDVSNILRRFHGKIAILFCRCRAPTATKAPTKNDRLTRITCEDFGGKIYFGCPGNENNGRTIDGWHDE
jgi:hypothetical protein